MIKKHLMMVLVCLLICLSACSPSAELPRKRTQPSPPAEVSQGTTKTRLPDFAHIVLIPFENREFDQVIGNSQMPNYNLLNSIRLDTARCKRSVVPFTDLSTDLAAGSLPDFAYIMPNLCNSAHNAIAINPICSIDTADDWLGYVVEKLQKSLYASGQPYLIIVTWDEGSTDASCCGLPKSAGGRVATLLISLQAKSGFQDATSYTHYSLLKTIESAWSLPFLGHGADTTTSIITSPWK